MVNVSDSKNPTITTVDSGATVSGSSGHDLGYYQTKQLSFVSASRGWVLLNNDRFLSTADGGATWTEISAGTSGSVSAWRQRQQRVSVDAIHLLTPDVGWALSITNNSLYWTKDRGLTWKTITPPGAGVNNIPSAFFLDTKQGWLFIRDHGRLVVFATNDAGVTWSTTGVDLTGVQNGMMTNRTAGQIYFFDALHGWISVYVTSGSNPVQSKIILQSVFATSDGGRTWNTVASDIGMGSYIRFATPTDGWMLAPPGNELYSSHDGARTWAKVSSPAPKEIYPAHEATYDLPTFEDSKHGYLPVTYTGGLGAKSAAVLFTTEDGGQTWKPDRTLANLNSMPVGNLVSSTVVEGKWITANVADGNNPTITTVASGTAINAHVSGDPGYYEPVNSASSVRRVDGCG